MYKQNLKNSETTSIFPSGEQAFKILIKYGMFQMHALPPLCRPTINISIHLFIMGVKTLNSQIIYHIFNSLCIFLPHSKHCFFKPDEFSYG